ncbi:MAG: small multi-drug export protein [Sulfurimicrobium sp.]|nr:small multi-drug export protein [Sulfurimicrobium sp.]
MHVALCASTEGRLLGMGLALTGLMLLAFGIGWQLFPDSVLTYAAMTGLNLIIGRAAGMSFGYASGLEHAQVIPLNMLVETIQVLVLYPLFALSWRQLIRVPRLQPFVTRMHSAAESRGGAVRKFGIVGLFVFVFVPFWLTGPVVGAIIGFLIGLRAWVNLAVVLVSTYLAIGVWGLLLNELNAWAATVNRFAPYVLVLAISLIVVAMHLLHRHNARSAKTNADL